MSAIQDFKIDIPNEKLADLQKRLEMTRWPENCLLYTSPSPRDVEESRMPSSA